MLFFRLLRIVKHFKRTEVTPIHESRVSDERFVLAPDFHQFRQLAEIPHRNVISQIFRHALVGFGDRPETFLSGLPEFTSQFRQVAAHRKLPAVFVHHLEIHDEVLCEKFRLEVFPIAADAGFRRNVVDQCIDEGFTDHRRPVLSPREEPCRVVRQGYAMPAQFLRQTL